MAVWTGQLTVAWRVEQKIPAFQRFQALQKVQESLLKQPVRKKGTGKKLPADFQREQRRPDWTRKVFGKSLRFEKELRWRNNQLKIR
jgi:hypothetical protein